MTKYVLGSSSRWRRELAKKHLGIEVALMPADIDERAAAKSAKDSTPESHTAVIAAAKLSHLLEKVTEPDTVIMCFDTVVFSNGCILEKPTGMDDAIATVRKWAKKGNRIGVYTGVAIGRTTPRSVKECVERADIVMTRDLQEEEIPGYIERSHGLESSGVVIVEELVAMNAATVEGDQSIIEGLPITATKRILEELAQ